MVAAWAKLGLCSGSSYMDTSMNSTEVTTVVFTLLYDFCNYLTLGIDTSALGSSKERAAYEPVPPMSWRSSCTLISCSYCSRLPHEAYPYLTASKDF